MTFTSSTLPRRSLVLVLGPIFDAGSRAGRDSGLERTACNERRAPLLGHAAATCVPRGAVAFHVNRSVRGPREFNVAIMCWAWLQINECTMVLAWVRAQKVLGKMCT